MGILHRKRSGNRAGADTFTKQRQQQALQGHKVHSLASQPPPPPPPPPPPSSGRNTSSGHPNAATKLQPRQPNKEAMEPQAAQLKQPSLPSAGRRRPQPKFPAVATKSETTTATMSETAAITQVYGPNANLYTDVLSVSPAASQQEIREAFFCLRYQIYQELSEEGDANGPLSQEERQKVEMKMNAISTAFQILSDRNRRVMYDNSIAPKKQVLPSPQRDSPTRQEVTSSSALSIGQRRAQYRRQMNARQHRPIQGAMNERKAPAPIFMGETVEKAEEPVTRRGITRSKQLSLNTTEEVIDQHQDEEESPTGVDDFESMNKFKNVKLDDIKSDNHFERDAHKSYNNFESDAHKSDNHFESDSHKSDNHFESDAHKSDNHFESDAHKSVNFESETPEPDDERTYDEDDDRTYDDDSRTYGTYDDGEESYYTYGDATYGTYDDSTYVTYDDDDTYDDDRGKYSPSHKTVDKPEPILKGSSNSGKKDNKKSNRRVTIHSHRGRGDNKVEAEGCPFPGLDDALEELAGTYKDFKKTFNQVGTAFILSPDDIDKLSDRIRDAQVELIETYEKQADAKQPRVKKGVKLPKQPKKAIKN